MIDKVDDSRWLRRSCWEAGVLAGRLVSTSRCYSGEGCPLEVSHQLLCLIKTGLVAGPEICDDVVSLLLKVGDTSGLKLPEAGKGGEGVVGGGGGGGRGL